MAISPNPPFGPNELERAFAELGRRALRDGKLVELAVYGGSALMLTFPSRAATKDVDAVAFNDPTWVRAMAAQMAEENGWPAGWLNDGVKGFLSPRGRESASHALFRTFPSEQEPGLRVFVASPHYLFAMKCLAMRVSGLDETSDRDDILMLARHLGIKDAAQAIEVVRLYYPNGLIGPKTRFGLEEMFSWQAEDKAGGT